MSDCSEIHLFSGQIDLIGHITKKGVILTGYIVDGRIFDGNEDKFDVIIYRGEYQGRIVAVKVDYNEMREGSSTTPNVLQFFSENKIKTFGYFFDKFSEIPGVSDIYLRLFVMDQLQPVTSEQAFPMLRQIVSCCFQYQSFMVHGDIKPDNIMYSKEQDQFYLIDYDSVCIEPLMYGFIRTAQTPLFATQSIVATPTITTLKHDLVELILSASAIHYHTESNIQPMIWNQDRFSSKRLFSAIYLVALNIDERKINNDDRDLLLKTIELTSTLNSPDLLTKIQTMIVTHHMTNSQILATL
jgi:serine/threonine protein kinase